MAYREGMAEVLELLAQHRLLPLLTVHGLEDLGGLARALRVADLPLVEVTLRTPEALEALQRLRGLGLCVGAGTVRTPKQAEEALEMGALFLVSPALNPEVARVAQGAGVPYLPGVLTPREVEEALALGLTLLKFFPAEAFQGAAVLRAYAEVFPEARFVPTGGIREENLKRYASLPNLLAVGGSWLLEGSLEEILARIQSARAQLNPQAHG
jgi:2-dehydro-3-deoxyphosphogluconate aldolase/(4S)-4-hydroxy-2-oxoglutarate aldolase